MKYSVKVYCEGYVVVGVKANSVKDAVQLVRDSSFYIGNDSCESEDTISIKENLIWCKTEEEYEKECALEFEKKYGHIFDK